MARAAAEAAPETEPGRCPTCPGAASTPFRLVHGWSFRRCGGCGLVFMDPRPSPEALRALYDERYFHSAEPSCGYADYEADREALREKARRLLAPVERWGARGRLLDVGCAYGYTLEVALERGWEVAGVEPAAAAAAAVAGRLGVRVEPDLLEARFEEAGFDAVTLWDVIEHLPDPRAALLEVRRILRPGGLCSVATPDLGSLAARLLGARWEEMQKMPEHIFFFDRPSLAALLRACGLEPLEWTTVGKRMSLDEALTRLMPAAPGPLRALRRAARAIGAHRAVAYLDPRWKAVVTARRLPGA